MQPMNLHAPSKSGSLPLRPSLDLDQERDILGVPWGVPVGVVPGVLKPLMSKLLLSLGLRLSMLWARRPALWE